jgi:hypothetical protein
MACCPPGFFRFRFSTRDLVVERPREAILLFLGGFNPFGRDGDQQLMPLLAFGYTQCLPNALRQSCDRLQPAGCFTGVIGNLDGQRSKGVEAGSLPVDQ